MAKYYIVPYGEGTKFKDRFKAAKFLREQLNFKGTLCRWTDWCAGGENAVYCCEAHLSWYGGIRIYRGNFSYFTEKHIARGDEVVVLCKDREILGVI